MNKGELKGVWAGLKVFARELPRVASQLQERLSQLGVGVRQFMCVVPLAPSEPVHALAKMLAELDVGGQGLFESVPGLHAARLMLWGDTERLGSDRARCEQRHCSDDPETQRPIALRSLVINLRYEGSLDVLLLHLCAAQSPLRGVLAMCDPALTTKSAAELVEHLKRGRTTSAYSFSDVPEQTQEEIAEAARRWRAFLEFYRGQQQREGAALQADFRAFWDSCDQLPFRREHRLERRLPDEQTWARRASASLRRSQLRAIARSAGAPFPRAVHAKHHACLTATFRVHGDLPQDLRCGIFAEPRSYEARIRLSNGSPTPRPDRAPDVRGMAIKLLEPEQDFLLINHPNMFVANIKDLALLLGAVEAGGVSSLLALGAHVVRGRFDLRIFLETVLGRINHPLDVAYHSTTPSRLGVDPETALGVKYSVVPKFAAGRSSFCRREPDRKHPDYLAHQLGETLHPGYGEIIELEFRVHASSAQQLPIEDATVPWPAVPVTVATLTIDRQDIVSERATADCQREFNPWHSLPEHLPIGSLNRARRHAYPQSAALRHPK